MVMSGRKTVCQNVFLLQQQNTQRRLSTNYEYIYQIHSQPYLSVINITTNYTAIYKHSQPILPISYEYNNKLHSHLQTFTANSFAFYYCTHFPGLHLLASTHFPGLHLLASTHFPGLHLLASTHFPGLHLLASTHFPGLHLPASTNTILGSILTRHAQNSFFLSHGACKISA